MRAAGPKDRWDGRDGAANWGRTREKEEMTTPTSPTDGGAPYDPSWVDRLFRLVDRLPVSAPVFYFLVGFTLIALQAVPLWLEEDWQEGGLLPVIIFNGLFTPFLLGMIHHLDGKAGSALRSMRPVLDMSESEFDQYQFKLSNMPPLAPLAAGGVMVALVILMERLATVPESYSLLAQIPVFSLVFHIVDKSSAFLFGVFIYHTVRQLRLVGAIHSGHVRIRPFHLGPLRAFSRLTASTAVGLIVGVYAWVLINPELLTDPLILGFALIITLLAVSIFVWPLYGVQRRVTAAKEGALDEIDRQFDLTFAKFNRGLEEDKFAAVEALNGTIASLEIQRKRLEAIGTWPWKPETARFAFTTIALPLVLAVLRFLGERVLNLLSG